MGRRKSLATKALTAIFRASHSVPAVGFLIAVLLGVAWWRLRTHANVAVQWSALVIGIVAIFFAVVAAAGFVLILLQRPSRRGRSN